MQLPKQRDLARHENFCLTTVSQINRSFGLRTAFRESFWAARPKAGFCYSTDQASSRSQSTNRAKIQLYPHQAYQTWEPKSWLQ